MKRSKNVDLSRMRKAWHYRAKLAPSLAIIAAGGCLGGCGEDVEVFSTLGDCESRYPLRSEECRYSYQQALQDADRYGPRYTKESDCEFDFGQDACRERELDSRVWFMPYMSGFAMHDDDYRRSAPLFSSRKRGSPLYKKWVNSQGSILGRQQFGPQNFSSSAFNKGSSSQRIFGRGGFGKLAASKARSGGSFSRGG